MNEEIQTRKEKKENVYVENTDVPGEFLLCSKS